MATYRLLPQAEEELDNIWLYVAKNSASIDAANRMIDAIAERFLLLAQHPHSGRARSDLRHGLRSFAAGDYVIIYRFDGVEVVILHVLHGRRDIARMLGE